MNKNLSIKIIKPDDWHVHLRQGDMMNAVINHSFRINKRCIVMPNLEIPVTNSITALKYLKEINSYLGSKYKNSKALLPCYLTDDLDLDDFKDSLKNQIFFGAKLYPTNATTNSSFGISNIEKIFPALEILEELDKPLLVHGEKIRDDIDIFDREKYFIDEELTTIRNKFSNLRITLEHVSSKYGADFVESNSNIAGTITPQHLMLTKNDVFFDNKLNPHNYCMPVVKNKTDLIALRKYACSGNKNFFLGTDSAPHHIDSKIPNMSSKAGIFSSPCSIELYASIFDEENALESLESFSSINGPQFYKLPINSDYIELVRQNWKIPEFTIFKDTKIKNFMANQVIKWKIKE